MFQTLSACALSVLLLAHPLAGIAADTLPGDWLDLHHQVVPGDTLEALALRYTGNRQNWQALQRLNDIGNPRRMPTGIHLVIPAALRPPIATAVEVLSVSGTVESWAPGHGQQAAVSVGQTLPEGTEINVAVGAYLRLRYPDGTEVNVPEHSHIRLTRTRTQPKRHINQADIQLEAGRVDARVSPRQTPDSRFRIHTPLAVASVRGTRFGVEIQSDHSVTSDVDEGHVSVLATGPGSVQELHGNEGVRISSQSVGIAQPLPPAPDLSKLPETVARIDTLMLAPPRMGVDIVAYRIRIGSHGALDQVVANATVAVSGQAQWPTLPDGDYMLGIRAISAAGLHGSEATRRLHIKSQPLPPLFEFPTPNSVVPDGALELRCVEPVGASRVWLQVDRNASFEHPAIDTSDVEHCRYSTDLSAGTYYWRLATVKVGSGGSSDIGPFSEAQSFQVVARPQAPAAIQMTPSAAGVQVSWSAAGANRYRVQVSDRPDFSTVLTEEVQTETSYRLPRLPSGEYFIRIRSISAEGHEGPFSTAWRVPVGQIWRSSDQAPLIGSGQPVVGGTE